MMEDRVIILEILSGPLDGAVILLETDREWSRSGSGPLCFPWDIELGVPQARFVFEQGHWYLLGLDAPHRTHHMSRGQRIANGARVPLATGDVLRAGRTWLLVRRA
jgi:hypothetical protein